MSIPDRIARLRSEMVDLEVDGFLVSAPENRRYLSGFTGSNGYLLITKSDAVLATDFRYIEQAEAESPPYRIHRTRGGTPWLPDMLSELGVGTLAIEADHMTVTAHSALTTALEESENASGVYVEETSGVVTGVRAVKDASELAIIEKAVEIADLAMASVASRIEPGMTEAQIAWDLEMEMRRLGAEGPAFDIIVGAGPNGALPHHRADDSVVRQGDPVVIDMGASYEGYNSDLTRTFYAGRPDDEFLTIYSIVLQAQETAIREVRPGMKGQEVDEIARTVIEEAGYGEEFGHGLGHGVGLAVHERPMVVPTSKDVIEDGMVFTVEPGIYISGWGGVRIEDIVVMENGRARILTGSPK